MCKHYYRNLEFFNIIELNNIRFMHLLFNTFTYLICGCSKEHKFYPNNCHRYRTCKTTAVEMLSSIVYAL